jgi:serine/threonine protein kinase
MKEIPFEDSNSMDTARQEQQLMSNIKHRHICKYIDSLIANGNRLYLVMEYCERGDLAQYLARYRDMANSVLHAGGPPTRPAVNSANDSCIAVNKYSLVELGENKVWQFFLQICLALETIHEQGIVHADLKPSNLLMSGRDYILKLTDFGVSKFSLSPFDFKSLANGNHEYLHYYEPFFNLTILLQIS